MKPIELKKIRKDLGYNQDEFAKLLAVHKMTVSRWERGTLRLRPLVADYIQRVYVEKMHSTEKAAP